MDVLSPLLSLLLVQEFSIPPPISTAQALAPDEKSFAFALDNGSLRLVKLPSGKEIWRAVGLSHSIECVSWSPDGSQIATVAHDGKLVLLRSDNGNREAEFGPGEAVFQVPLYQGTSYPSTVVFVDGGKRLLAVGGNSKARLLEAGSGSPIRELLYDVQSPIRASAISADGKHFAVGDDGGVFGVYSAATGALEAGPFRGPKPVHSLDFDATAERLAVGGGDWDVRVFTLASGTLPLRLPFADANWALSSDSDFDIVSVRFAPDGKTLLSSSSFQTFVRMWDLEHSKVVWEQYGNGLSPFPVRFSKDPSIVIVGMWDWVLDANSGALLHDLGGRFGPGGYAVGGHLAWHCDPGMITIVDPRTGKLVREVAHLSK